MARKATKTKRTSAKRMTKAETKVVLGGEPVFNGTTPTTCELLAAYTWYNQSIDDKQAKAYTLAYVIENDWPKDVVSALRRAHDWNFMHVGSTARIIMNGAVLDGDMVTRTSDKIMKIAAKYPVVETVESAPKVDVQANINERVRDLIADVDDAIDQFWADDNTSWQPGIWLSNQQVKPLLAKRIAAHYEPLLAEAHEIRAKTDDQLNEAYKHVKPAKVKAYIAFIQSIIAACNGTAIAVKATTRKPRARKEKSAAQVVSGVKYLTESPEFGLKSLNPAEIVGAQQVWTFNVRYRNLGVMTAIGRQGLSVKGTTVTGFDPNTAIYKRCRKPAEPLKTVLKGGKVALRKVLDDVSAKEQKLSGRINGDTIILRVIK